MSLKKEVTTPTSPLFPNYLWLTSMLRLTCLVLSGVWLIFGKCTNSGFIVPDLYFFGTGSVGSSNITGNGWNVFANHCQQWQDLRPVWTEVVLRSWRCKYGMTGYLWFIGLSMVFCYQCYISNMISTVCIYIYILLHTYRQFQGASAALRKHHHAMPPAWWVWSRRFRICISAVDFLV